MLEENEQKINAEYVSKQMNKFKKDLEVMINSSSIDNLLGVPDYILAQYLYDCLSIYGMSILAIEKHKGKLK